jgi:hypothetical protein
MASLATSETLGQKQERFARAVPGLLNKAFELGFNSRLGDTYRDPRVHGPIGTKLGYGSPTSCHKLRLAIDLNLFDSHGKYLDKTEHHKELGEWWEAQGPDHRWGGRFNDGNHYSIEHNGTK